MDMGGVIEIASSILSDASRSAEVAAQNIANITTPGYRRRISFSQAMLSSVGAEDLSQVHRTSTDFTFGKLSETGNTFDLALAGEGFFVVRTGSGAARYTRAGQFSRDADGRLADPLGGFLQADGADLVLREGGVEILSDGVVLEAGAPVARLDVVRFIDPAQVSAAQDGGFVAASENVEAVAAPAVRQGALEMSNVSAAAEMIAMMAALRRAESGQRLANVYDDLVGRVITTFGQA
jgi:flagellar basal-body rod protein FlgF